MASQKAFEAASDRRSKEVFVTLLTISSPDISDTLRFALNDEDIVAGGQTYQASGFQYRPPAQGDRIASAGTLRIDNVDISQSQAVLQMTDKPDVTITEVLASEPDTPVKTFPPFKLFNVSWDVHWMEGQIGVPDDQDARSVSYEYSPKEAPALYAG